MLVCGVSNWNMRTWFNTIFNTLLVWVYLCFEMLCPVFSFWLARKIWLILPRWGGARGGTCDIGRDLSGRADFYCHSANAILIRSSVVLSRDGAARQRAGLSAEAAGSRDGQSCHYRQDGLHPEHSGLHAAVRYGVKSQVEVCTTSCSVVIFLTWKAFLLEGHSVHLDKDRAFMSTSCFWMGQPSSKKLR